MTEDKDDMFDDMELLDSPQNTDTSPKDIVSVDMPDVTSPEWHDFVMSHFTEDELFDGNPTVPGLRRVSELLLGPIVFSGVTQVFPAQTVDHVGRCTVVYRVDFGNGSSFVDVADCWEANTDPEYLPYITANASTRAAGRAFRAALRIKTIAAEEIPKGDTSEFVEKLAQKNKVFTDEYDDSGKITDHQKRFLTGLCRRMDIDPVKVFQYELEKDIRKDSISKKEVSDVIAKINEYQKENIPEEIKGFSGEL